MIKRLRNTDLDMVERLLKEQKRPVEDLERIVSFLSKDANYFLAYIQEERIIGYVLAYALERYDGRAPMMYMHEIEVEAPWRRLGIGRKLLAEMQGICKENGFMKLFLITNKSNEPAVGLYTSLSGESLSDDEVIYTFKS